MLVEPLSQLEAASHVQEETQPAVKDWQYRVQRGYGF